MLAVDGDGDDKGEIACIGLDSVADAFTIHWRSWARNDLGLVTICGWKLNKISVLVPDTEAMTAMRNIAYFILSIDYPLSDYKEHTVAAELVLPCL